MTLVAILLVLVLAVPMGLVIFNGWLARRVETTVHPIGRFITIDGVRLHYLDIGSGPAVLMLHGLSSQMQTFTHSLTPRLEGRYRLILLDRPGSGYSQAAASAGLGAQSAIISAFLRALQVDRALIVGHSLGGAIALAIALDYPEQTAGLALLAPATQPQRKAPPALRGLAIASDPIRWIIAWTIAAPLTMANRGMIREALFAPDPAPPDFGTRAGSLLSMRPATYRNACRDLAMVGGDIPKYAARYGEIALPVGVLFGNGDRILDYAVHGQLLQGQIADLDFETIEGGGHMTPISSPDRAAAFIDRMAARAGLVAHEAAPAE